MQDDHLGEPVSVLLGHDAPVSYIDFSQVLPSALLSSSSDGTCRIWNVRDKAGQAIHVLRVSPTFATLQRPTRTARVPAAQLLAASEPQLRGAAGTAGGNGPPAAAHVLPTGMQLRHDRNNGAGPSQPVQSRAAEPDTGGAFPGGERLAQVLPFPGVYSLVGLAWAFEYVRSDSAGSEVSCSCPWWLKMIWKALWVYTNPPELPWTYPRHHILLGPAFPQ
jgi:hypothetical protein